MLDENTIEIREGTTRYVNITCKDKDTGEDFDFEGYTVQTHLSFSQSEQYLPTVVAGNIVSFEIPAAASVGEQRGVCETRIFKDDDVFEVYRINLSIAKAKKPDIVPVN